MKAIKVFVLGLLCGWLFKWVIDKVYSENDVNNIANEHVFLKESIQTFETKKQPTPEIRPVRTKTRQDDLQVLKGVGPASVKRLNNAGIYTFDELAQLKPEDLRKILGDVLKRAATTESQLIAQAKKLAQQKQNRSE